MSADTPRRDDGDIGDARDVTDADLEALFGRPVEVPSDASALDDLPPYAPVGHLDMSQDPDRFDPARDAAGEPPAAPLVPGPLDMSQDPDRYDPSRDAGATGPLVTGPLDMSQDPDRYRPGAPGAGQTLSELLGGSAAQDEERDSFVWLAGLLAVAAFLGLVALFFSNVEPG